MNAYLKAFHYPLDSKILLQKKRKIKRFLLSKKSNFIKIRIAVLGGSTTKEVISQLELFLLYHGIEPEFYQSEYGKFWEDAMFGNSQLDIFKPDIIYIHTTWRNIEKFPDILMNEQEIHELLNQQYQKYEVMWDQLSTKFCCPIIQNNFERPNYRLMGNRDIWDIRGRNNFLSKLNQKFYEYAISHEDMYINDIDYLAAEYGLSKWGDAFFWHMYKYAMCFDAIPYLAKSIVNIIKSIYGCNKKALILDLDNTLWGGVIGDDGVEGIAIGPEIPRGQVYSEFQCYCKELKSIGVVLAINSKNDWQNVERGLKHPDSILHKEDFVAIKANWNRKDQNIVEISKELNLGLDSFVFVDDSPVERDIVTSQLESVIAPDMKSPEEYIKIIDNSGFFEVTTLSQEDCNKTQMYWAKSKAMAELAKFKNYEEYLNSLEMEAVIEDFKAINIQRIAQLTNKTNQFNLTTLRCTENDIKKMQQEQRYLCLCGRLKDRFGDNGIVSVISGEKKEKELHICLWLMSCRVLKRELENVMMNELVLQAAHLGIQKIIGYYYPTAKNVMVKDLYLKMGFCLLKESVEGNSVWEMSVHNYKPKNVHINVLRGEKENGKK